MLNVIRVLLGKREHWIKIIRFRKRIYIASLEEYIPENCKIKEWKNALDE